jgi:hypothetical protein
MRRRELPAPRIAGTEWSKARIVLGKVEREWW